jgi:putative membrane protein
MASDDDSARALMRAAADLDPRVLMAAERTLLAWTRTGVAMMGFGFVVARFGLFLREMAAANGGAAPAHRVPAAPIIGTGLILLGAASIAASAVSYGRFIVRYRRGELLEPRVLSLVMVLAAALTIVGLALAVYLMLV